jgi:predicted nucleic acid-binding Zn ribbon protein
LLETIFAAQKKKKKERKRKKNTLVIWFKPCESLRLHLGVSTGFLQI